MFRILAFCLALILPFPLYAAESDADTLSRVEKYLSSIKTIKADFTQVAPSGDFTNGKFYLQRPGKLRMEYLPPTPILMVMSGNDVVYFDKELDQVSHIPLDSTLISFLARDQIKFDDSVKVIGIDRGDKSLRISVQQTGKPKDGTLTLEFADEPLLLRNMIVTDGGGQTTTVSLNKAQFDVALSNELFVFKDPHLSSGGSTRNKSRQ